MEWQSGLEVDIRAVPSRWQRFKEWSGRIVFGQDPKTAFKITDINQDLKEVTFDHVELEPEHRNRVQNFLYRRIRLPLLERKMKKEGDWPVDGDVDEEDD